MNLIRKNNHLRDELFFPIQLQFDKFFEEFFRGTNVGSVVATGSYPKMDILVEDDKWKIKAAIPGVNPDDIVVEMVPTMSPTESIYGVDTKEMTLKITGKMSEEYQSPEDAGYYVKELKKSSFQRQIKLPDWIKDDPEASFKDGMLVLSWDMPKETSENVESRRIDIKKE